MDTLLQIENLVTDRVAAHKAIAGKPAANKKYIGYLSNLIPLELIHAAGMQPIMLCGDPREAPTLANEFMEAAFDPITRSVFNRILKGDYNFLDLIVLPRGNDAYQRLYYYLCEIHRKHPDITIPPVYMLNLLYSPRVSTERHNEKQLSRFVTCLQVIAEQSITKQQIQDSVLIYNNCRNELHTFNDLRRQYHIPAFVSPAVYATVQTVDIEAACQTLTRVNKEITASEALNTIPRLMLIGNGLDHADLHTLVASLGASVVGDYHFYGQQFLPATIDTRGDLFTALGHYYSQTVKSTRTPPADIDRPLAVAKQQGADGLLFFFLQGEEALTWQVPKQLAAANSADIPCSVFYDQTYTLADPDLNTGFKIFIESIKNRGQP